MKITEQEVLRIVLADRSARDTSYERQMAIATLMLKGLLRSEGSVLRIVPSLFHLFRGI